MQELAYQQTASRSSRLPKFSDAVKSRWKVRRDQNGAEYIVLNGRNSLARDGLGHAYMISGVRVGAWLASGRICSKVQKLRKSVVGLRIEMIGDTEAVVSVPTDRIDDLCNAVKARRRRTISDKERRRLQRISPLSKSTVLGPKMLQTGKGVH